MSLSRRQLIGNYDIMGDTRLIGAAVQEALADEAEAPSPLVARGGGLNSDLITEEVRRAVAAKIMSRNALLLKETQPTKSRIFPLGFESDGPVASNDSVTITSRPQVLFRGERLVVPSDIAGDFTIDDLKVGKDSQFVAEGSIPARVLQENAVDVLFQLDTAQISQDITISATNIGGAPRVFRAALFGSAAE